MLMLLAMKLKVQRIISLVQLFDVLTLLPCVDDNCVFVT